MTLGGGTSKGIKEKLQPLASLSCKEIVANSKKSHVFLFNKIPVFATQEALGKGATHIHAIFS